MAIKRIGEETIVVRDRSHEPVLIGRGFGERMVFHFLATMILTAAAIPARADQLPFAIVYGPKGAFNIAAPMGWVIDNSAGAKNGMSCVLYRKGETWETADPLMYGKIASLSYEDADAFAKTAIEGMKKERGEFKVTRIAAGKTKGGEAYFINEYAPTDEYARIERVAYVQMPQAVAYFVYSGDDEGAFRKQQAALDVLLGSFTSLNAKEKKNK